MSPISPDATTSKIDAEKERMLTISDALAVAAGAAKAVVRQITKIEILEASSADEEAVMQARGQLGTMRVRYAEAQRVADARRAHDPCGASQSWWGFAVQLQNMARRALRRRGVSGPLVDEPPLQAKLRWEAV